MIDINRLSISEICQIQVADQKNMWLGFCYCTFFSQIMFDLIEHSTSIKYKLMAWTKAQSSDLTLLGSPSSHGILFEEGDSIRPELDHFQTFSSSRSVNPTKNSYLPYCCRIALSLSL